MKIGETKPVTLVPKVGPPPGGAGRRAAVDETVAAADTASIMGIPEAELTPKVRTAIMTLLDEVQRLRDELKQTQSRIDYLEQLADEDSLIPVINRRAFVHELSRMMSFAERYEVRSSMLYFDLNGMKAINDTYGHAAGDCGARTSREYSKRRDSANPMSSVDLGATSSESLWPRRIWLLRRRKRPPWRLQSSPDLSCGGANSDSNQRRTWRLRLRRPREYRHHLGCCRPGHVCPQTGHERPPKRLMLKR